MLDYAFTALGLHSVLLTVYAFNRAGIRAYEKAGFRECGRQREAHRRGGQRWDVVSMDCLAREFTSPVLGRSSCRMHHVASPRPAVCLGLTSSCVLPRANTSRTDERATTDVPVERVVTWRSSQVRRAGGVTKGWGPAVSRVVIRSPLAAVIEVYVAVRRMRPGIAR